MTHAKYGKYHPPGRTAVTPMGYISMVAESKDASDVIVWGKDDDWRRFRAIAQGVGNERRAAEIFLRTI